MTTAAIRFETFATPLAPDPARMDVACFLGYLAERPGAARPAALIDDLAASTGLARAVLAAPGGLYDRPVPLGFPAEVEALFAPETRLARRAVIEGGPMAEALPGSGVADTLVLVIDGLIREVGLAPLPATPEEAVQRIRAAGLGLEVALGTGPGGRYLRLALPEGHGAGTLAVLPCPSLGFPQTRRATQVLMPSAMGLALQSFFAMGGRKAIVISLGAPPAYDAARSVRIAALRRLLAPGGAGQPGNLADTLAALAGPLPSPVTETALRSGLSHLYGLAEPTFVLLPDLPELVAPPPEPAPVRPAPEAPVEVFADCLPAEATDGEADAAPFLAPTLDAAGQALWSAATGRVVDLLRTHVRDKLLIAALPRAGAGEPGVAAPRTAFLQLAEGWLRIPAARACPEGLMAPDGALAGHLARLALVQGTFVSAAALPLAPVSDVERRGPAAQVPTCRFLATRRGILLEADLTTSADPAWADGPVSRIMALILRQARDLGATLAFEPSGPALWARIEASLAGLMEAMRRAGALAGTGPGDSYDVRCDATTMSAGEIDRGILVAEVSFRPAAPIARITVRLPLTETGTAAVQGGPA